MENIVLGSSTNNRLSDDKVNKILPALSLLAEDVGEKVSLDSSSLREILLSVNADNESWAEEEVKIWANTLYKAKRNLKNTRNDIAIDELKNRGIPDFPARLAVYMVTNQTADTEQEKSVLPRQITGLHISRKDQGRSAQSSTGSNRKGAVDKPIELYHRLLPDHGWHNDLTWQQLPDWIKGNPRLIASLKHGKPIIGRNVIYKFVANKLIRRLRDRVPPAGNHNNRRRYR